MKTKPKTNIKTNSIPENFTMALVLVDLLPIIFFGTAMSMVGAWFRSPLFVLGAIVCTLTGLGKVIFKLIIVVRNKNIFILSKQFHVLMPLGLILLLMGLITGTCNGVSLEGVFTFMMQSVARWSIFLGILLMCLLGILGFTLDNTYAKNNWIEEITNSFAQFFILLGVIWLIYVGSYYHAGDTTTQILNGTADINSDIRISVEKDCIVVSLEPYEGFSSDTGFVFYPGGKVEPESYIPLMSEIAGHGILCVIARMPDNLAILNMNAAEDLHLNDSFPDVSNWYIGGHSLGGVMAASLAAKKPSDYQGVILMGAYTTANLSASGLEVLSMYGDKDHVMNMTSYEENRENLGSTAIEYIIPGGCHSYFGDYGMQEGDGTPEITQEEQWEICSNEIFSWILKK